MTAQCATFPGGPVACDRIQIQPDGLTRREAEAYCGYAADERQKVEAFWGATWTEPIRIHVSGAYRISRALVPAYLGNRGFMEMPLRRARDNSGALLHEIVHIYAPNRNRFLAEGLAVYLHTRLAGNAALPNWGEDLGRAYILAGSFVQFLIDRYDLRRVRSLYDTEDYEQVYGKPLGRPRARMASEPVAMMRVSAR